MKTVAVRVSQEMWGRLKEEAEAQGRSMGNQLLYEAGRLGSTNEPPPPVEPAVWYRAARTQLSLIVAACVLGLVILLKNVVGVSQEVLTRDLLPIYAFIYPFFALFAPVREGAKPWGPYSVLSWGLVIVLTTVAIVTLYSVSS